MKTISESSEVLNSKRKELLISLDDDKEVPTIDLATYGLTSYYNQTQMRDLSSSLHEKVLFLNNQEKQIKHIQNENLFFMSKQIEALEFIRNNKRIILSAPTSFGKTLILKEYIYLYQPDVVVFIVPTNALAYELESSFKNNVSFNEYEIFDKNKTNDKSEIDNNSNKKLFIGTQEKFLEIRHTLDEIDLFIIDEAYKLEDNVNEQRAYKLSKTFLDSQVSTCKKICLLSPNADFVGFEDYNFQTFETTFNAVDRSIHIIDKEDFFDILMKKSENNKTILYCRKPADISDVEPSIDCLSATPTDFVASAEKEFHPEWTVVKLLKKGVLSHHGLMPKYIQNKMINIFNNNEDFNLLIGTNSISEGINTPTKNLFLHESCDMTSKKLLVKNTMGRAGRLGKYPIGHIYSVDQELYNIEKERIIIKLALSNEDNLKKIEDTENEENIKVFCEANNIDEELYHMLIDTYKISIYRLQLILNSLQENLYYADVSSLPYMAKVAFSDSYHDYFEDKFYIKGTLNDFYRGENGKNKSLKTYNDKLEYIQSKIKNITKSQAMDGYMKFIYSTLDYTICPIVNIAKDIEDKYPNWQFGKNVKESVNIFRKKYFNKFFGMSNFDDLSENEKNILITLREYGINIIDIKIKKEILSEIAEQLSIRYSTYDIMHAILKLANSDSKNKNTFKRIADKYIRF